LGLKESQGKLAGMGKEGGVRQEIYLGKDVGRGEQERSKQKTYN